MADVLTHEPPPANANDRAAKGIRRTGVAGRGSNPAVASSNLDQMAGLTGRSSKQSQFWQHIDRLHAARFCSKRL